MTGLKPQGQPSPTACLSIHSHQGCTLLTLQSEDQTNRLTRACVSALIETVETLAQIALPTLLIIAGNRNFFSAGADLNEIVRLSVSEALEFVQLGQCEWSNNSQGL